MRGWGFDKRTVLTEHNYFMVEKFSFNCECDYNKRDKTRFIKSRIQNKKLNESADVQFQQ